MKTYKLLNAIRYLDAPEAGKLINASISSNLNALSNAIPDSLNDVKLSAANGIRLVDLLNRYRSAASDASFNVLSGARSIGQQFLNALSALTKENDRARNLLNLGEINKIVHETNKQITQYIGGPTRKESRQNRGKTHRASEEAQGVIYNPDGSKFKNSLTTSANFDNPYVARNAKGKIINIPKAPTPRNIQTEMNNWASSIPGKQLLPIEAPEKKLGVNYRELVSKSSGYDGPFRSENEQEKRLEQSWKAQATYNPTPKEEQRAETAMLVKKLSGGDPKNLESAIQRLNENRKRELQILIIKKKGYEGAKRRATIAIKKALGIYKGPTVFSKWKESEDRRDVLRLISRYADKIKALTKTNPKAGRAFNNFYTLVDNKGFSTKEAKYFHEFVAAAGKNPNNVWASELARSLTLLRDGYKRKLKIYKERSKGMQLTPEERKDLWLMINAEIKEYKQKLEKAEEARQSAKAEEEREAKERAKAKAKSLSKDSGFRIRRNTYSSFAPWKWSW